jgi:glycosyltransferase involved in cell wall biosynthesis
MFSPLSIIIPVFNEAKCIAQTLSKLSDILEKSNFEYEIIVIDDGSTDNTRQNIPDTNHTRIICHESNMGYGAAIKTGLTKALFERVCITDADGTYPLDEIPKLNALIQGHDMVVGSRTGAHVEYSWLRKIPKFFLKYYIEFITDKKVPDINSGLRIFNKAKALKFYKLYPNGFSFTTTITIAFITNGFNVLFDPISYKKRIGKSKIQPIRDTLRFFQLITRLGMYFAPIKVLSPFIFVLGFSFLASLGYDIFFLEDITDKSVLLLLFTLNTIFFALIADMIHRTGKLN